MATYRKVGDSPNIQDVLAKLAGKEVTSAEAQVSYSGADIIAAKEVLDRLLNTTATRAVSYVHIIAKDIYE